VLLEEVVEGLPEKGLHGGSALDGKPAELPGHFGREMSGNLLGARSSGFSKGTRGGPIRSYNGAVRSDGGHPGAGAPIRARKAR